GLADRPRFCPPERAAVRINRSCAAHCPPELFRDKIEMPDARVAPSRGMAQRKISLRAWELTMGKLSGNDIPKLAKILTSTLSFEDLEMFVQASTGDRLFDVYVSKDRPKLPMIVQLLNVLEDLGQTENF